MSHYSAAEWFEFASEMASSERRTLMESHLADGCEECRTLFVFWQKVLETGRREHKYEAPDHAVRSAGVIFQPEERWKWLPQIAQFASLLLDSFRGPAPAAIRGTIASSRQLLHEAKPYVIDLRVEYEPARKAARLIGQVLNSKQPAKSVTDTDIFLLDGERLAARTKTNASGEFQLEFKDEDGLQLFVDIRGQQVIEILLPNSPARGQGIAAGV